MRFSELIRLLEQNGFRIIKEKGSVRYYRDGFRDVL
jgi:predicted RNA binding protein YcfA (HicA-like mRNA interferase family)